MAAHAGRLPFMTQRARRGRFLFRVSGAGSAFNWRALMRMLRRVRVWADYITGGLACGLGGALLLGVPAVGLSLLAYSSRQWLKRHGAGADFAAWVWNHVTASVGQLPDFVLFAGLVVAPACMGFVYGWWAGMHRGRRADILGHAPNPFGWKGGLTLRS